MLQAKVEKEALDSELINFVKQGKCEESISFVKSHPELKGLVDIDGNHLLHIAAKHNNSLLIDYLVETGWDVTVQDSYGRIPFVVAVMHTNFEAATFLRLGHPLYRQTKVLFDSHSLEKTQTSVREDLVSKMRKSRLSSELIGEALAKAFCCTPSDVVRFRDAAVTKAYLRSTTWECGNAKLDEMFDIVAAKHDFKHILVILKNAPCDRNKLYEIFCERVMQEYIHYHYESKKGKKFLRRIFSLKVFNRDSLKYLEKALVHASIEALEIFLQYDFHRTAKVKYGRDLLCCLFGNDCFNHLYFFKDNYRTITSLLTVEQINVDGRGYNGKTPLHFAAQRHLLENVRVLLERGADPNAVDEKERTPLSLAVSTKHCVVAGRCAQCVKLLLTFGADPLCKQDLSNSTNFGHVVHLTVAQLMIDEYNKEPDEESSWYRDACRQQLDELKARKIRDDGQLSMFAVLTGRPEKLARHLGEEDARAVEMFVDENRWKLIQYYCDLLKKRAEDIVQMREYRRRATRVVCQFVGISDPHHLVVNKIVDYFSAKDLRKFSILEVR